MLTLVLVVILAALIFEFINGFHDTANSIATVVATKVLSPGQAVMLAAGMNLVGSLMGTAVAKTIASGLVNTDVVQVTSQVILCALLGGIVWNLITWWKGLPSSSSHALIGGLCGAALAAAHNDWAALIWSEAVGDWTKNKGILWKVVLPMITSPIAGFLLGILVMVALWGLIALLSRLGFTVHAATGRPHEADHLKALGASEVIDRSTLNAPGKPLQKERWAAAIDSVGSHTLVNVCAGIKYGGVVAACGLAQGMDFPGTVAPFILRGVTLAGVDSVMAPYARRAKAWDRLAREMPHDLLARNTETIGLADAPAVAARLLAGEVRGRVVVDVNA